MLKPTGIIRRIDDLGRVVLPKEIRRTLSLHEGDPLEIFLGNEGSVTLRKYRPLGSCVVCGKTEDLCKHRNGTSVCADCIDELSAVRPC